jgi:hypothetical protein
MLVPTVVVDAEGETEVDVAVGLEGLLELTLEPQPVVSTALSVSKTMAAPK